MGDGASLFLAIAAPWFVAVSRANPEFAQFFFVHEHFQRFLTTEHRRVAPAWFFIPILFAGFLPWMIALPAAIAHAWRREAGAAFQPLLLLWSAFILAFFSASSSKLPAYILPAFPAAGPRARRDSLGATRARARLAWVAPVALARASARVARSRCAPGEWTALTSARRLGRSPRPPWLFRVDRLPGAVEPAPRAPLAGPSRSPSPPSCSSIACRTATRS